jgi:hypothetical protein
MALEFKAYSEITGDMRASWETNGVVWRMENTLTGAFWCVIITSGTPLESYHHHHTIEINLALIWTNPLRNGTTEHTQEYAACHPATIFWVMRENLVF